MKTIKFDLPIDGVNVKTIEELREHFTVEILTLYNNGTLFKWLRSRKNIEELSHLEAIPVTLSRFSLLKTLCEIFTVDADDMIISAALGMQPEKMEKNFPEIKAQYRAIASAEANIEISIAHKAKIESEFISSPEFSGSYIIHTNGTVTNTRTGLMWKQAIEGKHNWHDAIKKFGDNVSFAGYNDWRIPTIDELITLLDSIHQNNIDPTAFPNTEATSFWSKSPLIKNNNFLWCINFKYCSKVWYSKDNSFQVRLVRS